MTIERYYSARNTAVKTITIGLVFLLFLPIGIPVSLIIIPFLAGRTGARELPKEWHSTFIITVGGGCSLGLVFILYSLLSLSLGPALKIGTAEPTIFGILIALIWGSFLIGVRNSDGVKTDLQMNAEEWDKIEENEMKMSNEGIAIPKETKVKENKIMEITPKKDIKDRLADIKTEHRKNKKRNARVKAESKKRRK
jgi:hypothetical protein